MPYHAVTNKKMNQLSIACRSLAGSRNAECSPLATEYQMTLKALVSKVREINLCVELSKTRKWRVPRIDEEGVGVTEEPMGPRMT